jgi:hypothetical protein
MLRYSRNSEKQIVRIRSLSHGQTVGESATESLDLGYHAKGGGLESVSVLLEGLASVFAAMASSPLTTLVSLGLAVLTLVLLNEFAK